MHPDTERRDMRHLLAEAHKDLRRIERAQVTTWLQLQTAQVSVRR